MADTRILPSATSGGLTRGTQGFVEARELNRRAALADRQENRENQRLGLEGRRVGLEEDRLSVQEQGLAFERLLQLAPLLPPGSTLAENSFLLPTARVAFQDLSEQEFETLQQIALNRETADTVMDDRRRFFLSSLDPNNPDDALILDRINLAGSGLEGASRTGIALQEQISGTTSAALQSFQEDPRVLARIGSRAFGIEPFFQIPGVNDASGEPIDFDSEAAGQLYVALMNNREEAFSARLKLDSEALNDIVTQLMEQAATDNIGLGRAFASNIVNSYNSSVGPDAEGEPGSRPLEVLYAGASDDEKRAIDLFVGTIRVGDNEWQKFLRETPEGQRQLLLGGLGQFLQEDLNLPSDQMMGALADFLDNTDIDISINQPFIGRDKFIFEETSAEPGGPLSLDAAIRGSNQLVPGADGIPAPANVDVVAAANVLRRGGNEAELRAEVGDAVVDAAIQLNAGNP